MTVLLSSLRVTAEMDASRYTAGAEAVDSANRRMADSGKSAGVAMAQYDASLERSGGTLVSLSKQYAAGYSEVSRFNQQVRQLQRQFEEGGQLAGDPNRLARTAQLYESMAAKSGLYADATKLVGKNNAEFAAIIDGVNAKAAVRIDMLGREAAAAQRLAQAQASQTAINQRLGVVEPGSNTASSQADILAYGKALDDVRAKYVPLAKEQKEYLTTLSEIRNNVKVGALSQTEGAAAIARTKEAFASQVVMIRSSDGAMGGHNRTMGGMTTQASALGAALRHSVDALGAGMSPMRVLMMELGNLSYGLSGAGALGSVMKDMGSKLLGLITPFRLLAAGAVAATATFVIMNMSWKASALHLDDLSRRTGETIKDLRELESAAIFKGVSSKDFMSSMEKFSGDVYKAKVNLGGLAEVFTANGVRAKNFNEYIEKAADLIKRAGSEEARFVLLAQMGLPATAQMVRFMAQGADGIRKAREEATSFGGAAENEMIEKARRFDEAWAKGWQNFSKSMHGTFVQVKGFFSDLFDYADEFYRKYHPEAYAKMYPPLPGSAPLGRGGIGSDANSPLGVAPPATVDKDALKNEISLRQQYISILGAQATVEDRIEAVKKQIELYNLKPGAIALTEKQVNNLTRLAAEQQLGTYAMKQQADAARIEAETIGMTTGAAMAYRLEQERIAQARRNGEKLSEKNLADLRAEAQAAGAAAQALANRNIQYSIRRDSQTAFLTSEDVQIAEKLKGKYEDVATALNSVEAAQMRANNAVRGLSQELSGGLSTALLDISMGTKQTGEAFRSFGLMAVQALQRMIIQLMIIGPLMRALQGGGGGFLSMLFGGFSGGGFSPDGSARGNVFDQGRIIHPYALGGITSDILVKPTYFPMANGGIGLGGEAGPEAIMPLRRGPDGRLGVSGQGGGFVFAPVYNIDASGSNMTEEQFTAILAKNNERVLKDVKRALPDQVAAINRDPRKRG